MRALESEARGVSAQTRNPLSDTKDFVSLCASKKIIHTRDRNPETRNPETCNTKHETRHPKFETRNPKPGTWNPEPETRNPKPEIRNPKPRKVGADGRGKYVYGTLQPGAYFGDTGVRSAPQIPNLRTRILESQILESQAYFGNMGVRSLP